MGSSSKDIEKGYTPMMRQFYELKRQHPEALLLFRCGDFFETYGDDAATAARLLNITLTRRNNGREGSTPTLMAGFPYHALDTYLPRLITQGRRVAICDQLEDPATAKKLVKRGITELVTPGVNLHEGALPPREGNFLCALHLDGGDGTCGVGMLDISTGEFFVAEGPPSHAASLVANFMPKEVVFEGGKEKALHDHFPHNLCSFAIDDWEWSERNATERLLLNFNTQSLKGFGVEHLHSGIVAAGAILHYLDKTHHLLTSHITRLQRIDGERYVRLDPFTLRSLELLAPLHPEGTPLVRVLDHTLTPMGARLLRRWMAFPLQNVEQIERRQSVVAEMAGNGPLRRALHGPLSGMGDMERLVSKVAVGRIGPRDMVALASALTALVSIREACLGSPCPELQRMGREIDPCTAAAARITATVNASPPLLLSKGGVVREGVNGELDELRLLSQNSKDFLAELQRQEMRRTGINSLKVGYNNVYGYYLEVRNTFRDAVPSHWIRRQTLTNAERYVTEELKGYEEKILGAENRIAQLELEIFTELTESLEPALATIQRDAHLVARIDSLLCFANDAIEFQYVRPEVDNSSSLSITQGRHPVIERLLPEGENYVPNDVTLDCDRQQIIVVTGPNMAGKSALLRQTALITIMAQMGCFVPARNAHIGAVDKIFTRVGASDNISMGESTFMTEMTEAANILNNASPRSLILFDELGRGTSTYDGISIAWAILEHLHNNPRCQARTLFATHYHELNEMCAMFPRIRNFNVSVAEHEGRIVFLRKLRPGGSEHSFGIHVARLAGMPPSIVQRADQVLRQLERERGLEAREPEWLPAPKRKQPQAVQTCLFQLPDPELSQLRDRLTAIDVNNLTPLEALNRLAELCETARKWQADRGN